MSRKPGAWCHCNKHNQDYPCRESCIMCDTEKLKCPRCKGGIEAIAHGGTEVIAFYICWKCKKIIDVGGKMIE